MDFETNSIFLGFIIIGTFSFYVWYRTTNKLSSNDRVIQAMEIISGLVLSLSFMMMVYEHNRKNNRLKKERILQLTLLNREYWLRIIEIFMKYPEDLLHLSNEIFIGIDIQDNNTKAKTDRQKGMEFYVIEIMFQMLVDVYRLYDINYLPKDDITGWSNTYMLIFSSATVRQQWKHSRFLYGNSSAHDFIEKYGIVNNPRKKLLDEMRKSHMVTMIRNSKMKLDDFKEKPNLNFKDITAENNNKDYLHSKFTI